MTTIYAVQVADANAHSTDRRVGFVGETDELGGALDAVAEGGGARVRWHRNS